SSAAVALVAASTAGVSAVLAGVSANLALFWLAALLVAAGKGERAIPAAMLATGAVALPALVAVAGGVASPLSVLLAALAIEPVWAVRSAAGRLAGILAVGLAAASFAALPLLVSIAPADAQPWHWIPALAYLAFVAARLLPMKAQSVEKEVADVDLLEASGALVFTLSATGDVSSVRGRSKDVIGVPSEILLGGGLFERLRVSDRVGFLCALGGLRNGGPAGRVSALVRAPIENEEMGASYRLFDFDLVVPGAGNGNVIAIARRSDDVERLSRELANAEQSRDAMDMARNRLLASVSHELRTPLNAIIGFSDMLLLELFGKFGDPRQKEYVTLVRDSGHHLLDVVNSILDVSKIESGAYSILPEPFVLTDAVEMCRSMMDGQARSKSICLSVSDPFDASEIVADRRAVQQMLINLISNAIKFTPAGGAVTIRTSRTGSFAKLAVIDNGIGIEEKDLARIGEPFTQVHNDYTRQFDGAGLGLSLVKGLVSLHGGSMSIESAPAQGTTVTISLPIEGPSRSTGQAKVVALAKAASRDASDGSLRKTA
ncbi:MAG: sensor histidine kinase, partial [Rhizobiaceae bacterium]